MYLQFKILYKLSPLTVRTPLIVLVFQHRIWTQILVWNLNFVGYLWELLIGLFNKIWPPEENPNVGGENATSLFFFWKSHPIGLQHKLPMAFWEMDVCLFSRTFVSVLVCCSQVSCPIAVKFLWVTELTDVTAIRVMQTDLIGIPPAICFGNSWLKLNLSCYQLFTSPSGKCWRKTH